MKRIPGKAKYNYQEYLEKYLHARATDEDIKKMSPYELGSALASRAISEIKETKKQILQKPNPE
jgi:hypothetical protein